MRTSLTVGGVEVELSTRAAELEQVIVRRYAPFLGSPKAPVASVELSAADEAAGVLPGAVLVSGRNELILGYTDLPAGVDFSSPIRIRTVSSARHVDRALEIVFSVLAPAQESLLLSACGVIVHRCAHVFAGGSDMWLAGLAAHAAHRPVLSESSVLVHQVEGRWFASSAPFGDVLAGPPRQAPLAHLWVPAPGPFFRRLSGGAPSSAPVQEAATPPSVDPDVLFHANRVFGRLVAAVPVAELPSLHPTRVWDEVTFRAVPGWDERELSLG